MWQPGASMWQPGMDFGGGAATAEPPQKRYCTAVVNGGADEASFVGWHQCPGCDRITPQQPRKAEAFGDAEFYSVIHCSKACERGASPGIFNLSFGVQTSTRYRYRSVLIQLSCNSELG